MKTLKYKDWVVIITPNLDIDNFYTIEIRFGWNVRFYDIETTCERISQHDEYIFIYNKGRGFHQIKLTEENCIIGDYFKNNMDGNPTSFAMWDFNDEEDTFEFWFECNYEGDILNDEYDNYVLNNTTETLLPFKEWAEEYYNELNLH